MSAKGLTYWENVWNQANTQFEIENPLNRDKSTQEQRARHKNLYLIDAMLKNYSGLYFTTYGKKLAEYYRWDAPAEPQSMTLTQLRSSFVERNSHHYSHPYYSPLGLLPHIEVYNGSKEAKKHHYFISHDKNDDITRIENTFAQAIKNEQNDSVLHMYQVKEQEDKNIANTAKNHPEYNRLKNAADYASIQVAMRNMRQHAIKSDSTYENGDLHQLLQVIEKKTGVSINDMGFKIKQPEPSFFSCLFNCLFPPVTRTAKEEKAPLVHRKTI